MTDSGKVIAAGVVSSLTVFFTMYALTTPKIVVRKAEKIAEQTALVYLDQRFGLTPERLAAIQRLAARGQTIYGHAEQSGLVDQIRSIV